MGWLMEWLMGYSIPNKVNIAISAVTFALQNRYWESDNAYNSKTYIDDVNIICSMSQSVPARSIEKSDNISQLLHNPLNTALRIYNLFPTHCSFSLY